MFLYHLQAQAGLVGDFLIAAAFAGEAGDFLFADGEAREVWEPRFGFIPRGRGALGAVRL